MFKALDADAATTIIGIFGQGCTDTECAAGRDRLEEFVRCVSAAVQQGTPPFNP